jgi:5'-phosphate synthase pdxT subunit
MSAPSVGVLALQGDTREHLAALSEAGAQASTVRRRAELDAVDALVIPGGESTTMSLLLCEFDLLEPLRQRLAAGMPAYGSCAGMILLASEILDPGEPGRQALPLGAIDMTVRRNAFGRQVDSFEADVRFAAIPGPGVRAVFIRAPWVESVGPGVQILARVPGLGHDPHGRSMAGVQAPMGDRIVAVRAGNLLATSFHPELTGDNRVHGLFVDIVRAAGPA